MTYYFWQVNDKRSGEVPEDVEPYKAFNRAVDPGRDRNSLCAYLNDDGAPVIVSFVTQAPRHGSGFKDVTLADTGKEGVCLTDCKGYIQEAGRNYCRKNGIAEDPELILRRAVNGVPAKETVPHSQSQCLVFKL